MRISVFFFSTLPIELLQFRAVPVGNTVHLDWATATELNNDRFIVQRSRDQTSFEDVLMILAQGIPRARCSMKPSMSIRIRDPAFTD